ncbi:Uncharacterized protein BM_BM12970 [Brugia malayi]|uniref:Uncharacterized protein n=2 Tax=Brugia TaxID=6278 RepID=A0A4E9FKJ0_BRUMA|nr:Uncharacterized protein BM_BM12970 [Brugia malayi]VDO08174.1 unnamed protein product [Brugia timori]VIO96849.1 Uncharacterized protein BM_BM12970 [Brugia malayi]
MLSIRRLFGFCGSIGNKSLKTLCFTGRLCQDNTEIKIADQTAENVGWFDEPFSKDISAAMLALADKKLLVFAEQTKGLLPHFHTVDLTTGNARISSNFNLI